jgi:hypothetical protein
MKERLLVPVIMTLFFISPAAYSQVNSYFLNDPAWKVKTTCWVSNWCLSNEFYNYFTNGDTVINTLVYKKIYRKGYTTYTDHGGSFSANCQGPDMYNDPFPNYFLRSAGKQMFVRFPGSVPEVLLYDFNLQVGDTLPVSYNNYATDVKVTAIDSIYTSYGYRKRFELTGSTNAQYLFEGIGHSNGLVEYMGSNVDCFSRLECFSLNDIAYLTSAGATCMLAVGIGSYETQPSLSVFPNPFITFTTIHFNSIINDIQLNIYDHAGQKIRISKEISDDKVKIERGSLNSGLYFYEVMQDNRSIATGKLIITD